jgi:hypothetical protein
MTPQEALTAYQSGKLQDGTLVHQPFGFLQGERLNGRVHSVCCRTDGEVYGVMVQWPDEPKPIYAQIEELDLGDKPDTPDTVTLMARAKAFFTRLRPQPQQ